MPRDPRVAESYDEITRRTVPNPDSSFRPSPAQEQAAYEGARALDDDERALHARVAEALTAVACAAPGLVVDAIEIEITRTAVTLRGQVPDPSWFDRIEDQIRAVDGVSEVHNDLVVAPAATPAP